MEREDHCKALAEYDAVQVALVEWMERATRQTPAAVEEAARRFTNGLVGVIGRPAARRYAATLWAYRQATVRLHALRATFSAAPFVDAADTESLRQVVADQAEAGRAHEAAAADVVAAVEMLAVT